MAIDSSWTEPASDYKGQYPYNNINQSESGHFFEMDDTPGAERLRLQHRTGTFTEVQANGQRINKVVNDNYEIIMGNDFVQINGQCNITVKGACVINVQGDAYTNVQGNAKLQVQGNSYQQVNGTTTIGSSGDINLNSSGDINMQAASVNVNAANMNVNGGVTSSQSVSALGNVTAGMNLSAALSVQTLGFITAGTFVSAPLGTFTWMRDSVNEAIFDSHTHIGNLGSPTSPPLTDMV